MIDKIAHLVYVIDNEKHSFHHDELLVLSDYFDSILVFPIQPLNFSKIENQLPPNVKYVYTFSKFLNFFLIKIFFVIYTFCFINKFRYTDLYTLKYLTFQKASYVFFKYYLKLMNLKNSHVILYSFWFNPVAVAFGDLSKTLGYCSIARAHGYDLYNFRSPIGQFPNRRNALNNLSAIFVASVEGSNYLRKMFPEYAKKIYSSRLGICDLGNFLQKGIKENYTFVSCSNLYDLKRVEYILYLLRHLAQANRHLRFEWHHFGDGPEMAKLVSLVNSEYNDNFTVIFHGYIENMVIRKWYAKNYVDFFVNYSSSEGGCPISIMEALNNGIPVIAPNVGGIPEIVSDQNGILFDAKTNPIEIAHRMQSFIEMSDAEITRYRTRSAEIFLDLCLAKKNYREFIEFILKQIFKY